MKKVQQRELTTPETHNYNHNNNNYDYYNHQETFAEEEEKEEEKEKAEVEGSKNLERGVNKNESAFPICYTSVHRFVSSSFLPSSVISVMVPSTI